MSPAHSRGLAAVVIVCSIVAGSFWVAETPNDRTWAKVVPGADMPIVNAMLEKRRASDYAAAISLALSSNGGSPDDSVLHAIADTYFERAQEDRERRGEWVVLAIEYSQRALNRNPDDLVNSYNLAQDYLTASMNSEKPQSCDWLQKSLNAFRNLNQEPRLKGYWARIEGHNVFLPPLRKKIGSNIALAESLNVRCEAKGH
jgi:hypothetical protein